MDASHLSRLRQEQEKALTDTDEKIAQWNKFKSDYEALQKRLKTLPDKVTHDIMVPFGSLAMMPGKLVHTNEVTVLLGDNWFVERSAKQAAEIAGRRILAIDASLKELHEQRKLLTPRRVFTQELEAMAQGKGEMKEIVEEYDPVKEKEWREQHRKNVQAYRKKLKEDQSPKPEEQHERPMSDEALWARLDELERVEMEGREFDRMDEADDAPASLPGSRMEEPGPVEDKQRVKWADEELTDESDTETTDGDDSGTSASDYDTETEEEEARRQMSRITFTHTQPSSSRESSSSGASPTDSGGETRDIKSPGDIYRHFLQPPQPKSILKKKKTKFKTKEESKTSKEKSKASRTVSEGSKQAFTGTVVEKPTAHAAKKQTPSTTDTVSSRVRQETGTEQAPRRVSKFRSQRQQKGDSFS